MPALPTSPPYSSLRPPTAHSSFPSSEWSSPRGVSREDLVTISDEKSDKSFWSPAAVPVVPKLPLKHHQHVHEGPPDDFPWLLTQDPQVATLERSLLEQLDPSRKGDRTEQQLPSRLIEAPLEPPSSPPPLINLARLGRGRRAPGGSVEGPVWRRKRRECERLRRIVRARATHGSIPSHMYNSMSH